MTSVLLSPLAMNLIPVGGDAVYAAFGPLVGGFVTNPFLAADQGLGTAENLFVDITGPAALEETETTIPLLPGQTFTFPSGMTTDVSVNAVSNGHRFSGIVIQPPPSYPPIPQSGTFPPTGPVTLTKTIPATLYQEYNDDEDCQAFFSAYNTLAQGYVDWFVNTPLAVYTNPNISGSLLDWVALGLYGMARPTLSSGQFLSRGPYNTWAYNTIPFNKLIRLGPSNIAVTTDDVFKRILTWNLYRGDGMVFSIRWLKRRVMRFLTGANGSAPNIDNTDPVSVTVGDNIITIALSTGGRVITGGALYNRFGYNRMAYNALRTQFVPPSAPALPLANVLKETVAAGVLVFPFQYIVVVRT